MRVSHSEISTYLDCQKKWELQYKKGISFTNNHLIFGGMAHKVLETRIIPDESLYIDLKEEFDILSWREYFLMIFEELDNLMRDYELIQTEYRIETDEMVGIIDAVWKNKNTNKILLTDYKFTNYVKTTDDLLLDEQLYIYAVLYCAKNGINLNEIEVGYISIPKTKFNQIRVLKNGSLSKDKAQLVSYDKYVNTIKEKGLDFVDYEEFLNDIKDRKIINLIHTTINTDMCERIMRNIDYVIKDMKKGYVLEKCTGMCKKCDYVQYCKHNKVHQG